MKIHRLRVTGFGSLKGDFIFSSDRCNLILEPNESGKSTLASALLAALYGLPRERASRERPITTKDRHRPWNGGPYALEMEIECGERTYVVRRDFERDTAAVLDGRTGRDITPEFAAGKESIDLGLALTGLSRQEFTRCCFVAQREIENLRDAAGLTHALQRIASSQQGDIVAGEAIETLTRAVERDYVGMRLGRGKVETEIRRLDREIDEVRSELEAIAARRRQSEEKIRRLEEATNREGQVEDHLSRVDQLTLLALRAEIEADLAQCQRDEREMQAYRAEAEALAPYAGLPAERLGELRELKGRVESLEERRAEVQLRLAVTHEAPLQEAEEELTRLGSFEPLADVDATVASDRLAVIQEMWALRRDKRRAWREESRRLGQVGVDTARATALATSLNGLAPEDRSFLSGYRERLLEARAALSEAELNRDRLRRAEGGDSPALVSLAEARRAETLALVAGIAGLALSFVLWLSFESKLPFAAAVLVAIAGFLYWFYLFEQRPVPGAEEFGTDLQKVQTELWNLEKDQAALKERLLRVASRVGHYKADQLLEDYRELEALEEKAAPLTALASSIREIESLYATAAQDLLGVMKRASHAPARGLVTPRVARGFRDGLLRYLEGRQRIEAHREGLEAGLREVAGMTEEIERLRLEASTLLEGALGPDVPRDDLSDALSRFEEAAGHRERLDRLRFELLPAAERRGAVPAYERAASLTRERDILSRQIDRAVQGDPSLAQLLPERSSRAYGEQRRQLQEEARRTQRDRLALSEELGDVLKEYRRDYPGRQALLGALESARARAVAFDEAVGIALETLGSISREAYAEWAEVLNERATEFLRRLNPYYEDVRFDTDLSFTLRDVRDGQRRDQAAVDTNLSTGARDQIYLAARMAAAEYLSVSGARLPVILDDPFASFDDERFERAMEFLLDTMSRRHQIILLSCHEARHQRWRERSPGSLADRLRVVDLTPLST